jgi:O-antigen/teichoic acid export membrane protein
MAAIVDGDEGRGDGEPLPSHVLFSRRLVLIGIAYLVSSLSFLVVLPILTRNLTAADYGLWVLVLASASLSPLLANLGLPGALVRFLPAEEDVERVRDAFYSVLLTVLCVAAATSAVIALLAPLLAVGSLSAHVGIIRVTALVIFVECLNSVLYNYLRALQRIKLYTGFLTAQTVLLVVLLAVALLSGTGLMGAVLALLASRALVMVSMMGTVVRELRPRWPVSWRLREFLGYGAPLVPTDISDWAISSSDRYLIGAMLGAAAVGYYNPGYGIAAMILMLAHPLKFILPAALSEMYDKGMVDRVRTYLRASLKYFLVLAVPASLGLSLLARELLLVLTTKEISSEGYIVMAPVAAAMVLGGAQIIVGQVLILEKRTRSLGSVMGVTAVLNVVINLALLPWTGIVGAAWSTLAAYAFSLAATAWIASARTKVGLDIRAVGGTVLATCVMGAVVGALVWWGLPGNLPGLVATIVVGVGVYAGAILALGTISPAEVRFFLGLVRVKGGSDGTG